MTADRFTVAVEALQVRPGDRVLEVGGGTGVAAGLILEALGGKGELVGVDRSAAAVAASAKRHPRARFVGADLASADSLSLGRFDRILAVNVNVFWTGAATTEIQVLKRLLRKGGRLVLCYDRMDEARVAKLAANFARHSLPIHMRRSDTLVLLIWSNT